VAVVPGAIALPKRGYTLDLDTTRLLHEDAHGKEGVRTGYTPKGCKRCFNPLLGRLPRAKLGGGLLAAARQHAL